MNFYQFIMQNGNAADCSIKFSHSSATYQASFRSNAKPVPHTEQFENG